MARNGVAIGSFSGAGFAVCRAIVAASCLAAATPGVHASAQAPARPDGARAADTVAATRDPTLPAGALRGFVNSARRGEWQAAAARLDLSSLPPDERATRGPNLAWQLKVVLDRKLPLSHELLSKHPEGDEDDGLPPGVDRVGRIDGVEILLERGAEQDSGRPTWQFSASTVDAIPELYARHGYGALGELLPAWTFERSLLFDLQLWQWLGLLLLALGAGIAAWILGWIGHRIARGLAARSETSFDDRLVHRMVLPFRLLLALGLFAIGTAGLALPLETYQRVTGIEIGLAVALATWVVLRGIDIVSRTLHDHLVLTEQRSAIAGLPLLRRGLKLFLLAVALVVLLQNVGFNVTGLLAGLGVGGLAVALAAQKSIANLFGGVSLIADQPVRVGDTCRFGEGNRVGTVEEVGLRSTRIRTFDRTLITIPNAEFSEIQLENFAARDRIRLLTVLGLRYETTPDQMRHVLAGIRTLLIAHPKIAETPLRARFVAFGAHSLDVEVVAYVETTDWSEFLAVREDVFLQLMEVVAAGGTGFAFPSQTLYLGRDSGLDAARTAEAEERVRQWRERGELPFPEFSPEQVTRLDGSGSWPPTGSAVRESVDGPPETEGESP